MTKIKLSFKSTFDEFVEYDLTENQVLFFTADENTPPLVIPRHLFQDRLGNTGALTYSHEHFCEFLQEPVQIYRTARIGEYWQFCDHSQILTDLREYLKTL